MQIVRPGFAGDANTTFFNHGVSGATIEDDIAILELYLENGPAPRTIIIDVDPWILNANNRQMSWMTLKGEYENGTRRIGAASTLSGQSTDTLTSEVNR
jgi:hypothetical protein